jgi:hypothetical protein
MGFRSWWASWRSRYEALVEEYGGIAVATYFSLFFATWFGFWIAIRTGWSPDSAASMGTVGLAWVLTKTTQPVRIGLTVVLTPLVVRLRRSRTAVPGPTEPTEPPPPQA